MSFHRVLPRPLALSNSDLARRWAIVPNTDALGSAKTMTDERSNSAFQKNAHVPPPSLSEQLRKTSSSTVERPRSDSIAEEEDLSTDLPREIISSGARKPAPSSIDTWQEDSPSQICLCQPDPKVPRPRNGKCPFFRLKHSYSRPWLTRHFRSVHSISATSPILGRRPASGLSKP